MYSEGAGLRRRSRSSSHFERCQICQVIGSHCLVSRTIPPSWHVCITCFRTGVPELNDLHHRVMTVFDVLRNSFCDKRSVMIIGHVLKWHTHAYVYAAQSFNQDIGNMQHAQNLAVAFANAVCGLAGLAYPSAGFVALTRYLSELRVTIEKALGGG